MSQSFVSVFMLNVHEGVRVVTGPERVIKLNGKWTNSEGLTGLAFFINFCDLCMNSELMLL